MVKMQKDEVEYAGLQILNELDGLFVEQSFEVLETFTGGMFEGANKYMVYDPKGKIKLFHAKEKTSCCWRQCCGESRPFNIKVYDHTGDKDRLVLVLKRGYKGCGWAVIPCCAQSVGVHYMLDDDGNEVSGTSSDTLISRVEVPWCGGCCQPTMNIKDGNGVKQGSIKGPCLCVNDCCGADFDVYDREGEKAGEITKMRVAGLKDLAMEFATDADKFRLKFPPNLPPQMKMAILAATFQIDFWFFEDDRNACSGRCCDIYCCGWALSCLPAWCFCCCGDDDDDKKKKKGGAPGTQTMER